MLLKDAIRAVTTTYCAQFNAETKSHSSIPVSELASGRCAEVGTEHSTVSPFKVDDILISLTEQP